MLEETVVKFLIKFLIGLKPKAETMTGTAMAQFLLFLKNCP